MASSRISSGILVARFLKSNGYTETLDAFLREAGLPPDAGEDSDGDGLTVDKILSEKKIYDLSVNFEKLGSSKEILWTKPSPSIAVSEGSFPMSGNVLQVGVVRLKVTPDQETQPGREFRLVSTAADKCMRFTPLDSHILNDIKSGVFEFTADASVLSYAVVGQRFILFLTISGKIGAYDVVKDCVISTRSFHSKFGIRIITTPSGTDGMLVATAGWDRKVQLAFLDRAGQDGASFSGELSEPVVTLQLDSLPEDILFKRDPDNGQLYLIITRRDSTFLYYYAVDESQTPLFKAELVGRQNLAPYANSWNVFSPSCISPCPTDPSLVAVATSSVPHMKVLLVRLLYPSPGVEYSLDKRDTPSGSGDVSNSREALAILIHCNTMVAQTQYSVPLVTWRPDGSGVWVNSDDGIVKGIDLTGKIVSTLKGHDAGCRVRCFYAGYINDDNNPKEIVISGGFDQRVITWEIDDSK